DGRVHLERRMHFARFFNSNRARPVAVVAPAVAPLREYGWCVAGVRDDADGVAFVQHPAAPAGIDADPQLNARQRGRPPHSTAAGTRVDHVCVSAHDGTQMAATTIAAGSGKVQPDRIGGMNVLSSERDACDSYTFSDRGVPCPER